jgi:hypoxanthine phosphoribosyltransferase
MPLTILLTGDQIQDRIRQLAIQIERDYPPADDIHFVAVLKGAFMFLADLVRAMRRPVTVDFIAVSSYGAGSRSSGEVRLLKDVDASLNGRHVILVEDIVDSGLTLAYIQGILLARSPASLRTVCLLNKPGGRRARPRVDYIGFDIPDRYVVGYGLDQADRYRQLPGISVIE